MEPGWNQGTNQAAFEVSLEAVMKVAARVGVGVVVHDQLNTLSATPDELTLISASRRYVCHRSSSS